MVHADTKTAFDMDNHGDAESSLDPSKVGQACVQWVPFLFCRCSHSVVMGTLLQGSICLPPFNAAYMWLLEGLVRKSGL